MRQLWIAVAIALAGCGDDLEVDQPVGPDCSIPAEPEPVVPDGAVQLNESCTAACPAITAAGDGFLVAWSDETEQVMHLDSSGAPSGPIHELPGGGCPAITHRNGVATLAYHEYGVGIWLARFDDDGNGIGEPVLAVPRDGGGTVSLAASPDGYALVWQEGRSRNGPQDILFAALDEQGALVGEPRVLAAGEIGDESDSPFQDDVTMYDGPAVATVPDGVVAVWYTRTTIEMHHLGSDGTELAWPSSQPAHAPNRLFDYDLVEYSDAPLHLAASSTRVLASWREIDSMNFHVTEAVAPSLETGTTTRLRWELASTRIAPTASPEGFLALWDVRLEDGSRVLAWIALDQDGDEVGDVAFLPVDVDQRRHSVGVAHGSEGYVLVFANQHRNVYAMPLPMSLETGRLAP